MAVKIEIVSPERLLFSEVVQSATLPGAEGYFTVLGDHAPVMSVLRPGFVTVVNAQGTSEVFFVRGGFADVSSEGVTILAEQSVPFAELQISAIEGMLANAEAAAAAAAPEYRLPADEVVYDLRNVLMEARSLQVRGAA